MFTHKQLEAIIELIDEDTNPFGFTSGDNLFIYKKPEVEVNDRRFTTLSAFINWVREGNHCAKVDYFIYNSDEEFDPDDAPFVSYPELRDALPEIAFDTCNLIAFKNHYDLYTYRRIRYTYEGKVIEYHAHRGDATFERVKENTDAQG